MRSIIAAAALAAALPTLASAADMPAACPTQHVRVVHSIGAPTDYLGILPGMPELCHLQRADGAGDFYFGSWRSDWPGAGQAYPALHAVILGGEGTKASFVTRSVPGLQWTDTLVNGGVEPMVVDGRTYQTLKLAHERQGIEGNTYHSIITSWRDVATGLTLRAMEHQIAGESYGPDATWIALKVETLP